MNNTLSGLTPYYKYKTASEAAMLCDLNVWILPDGAIGTFQQIQESPVFHKMRLGEAPIKMYRSPSIVFPSGIYKSVLRTRVYEEALHQKFRIYKATSPDQLLPKISPGRTENIRKPSIVTFNHEFRYLFQNPNLTKGKYRYYHFLIHMFSALNRWLPPSTRLPVDIPLYDRTAVVLLANSPITLELMQNMPALFRMGLKNIKKDKALQQLVIPQFVIAGDDWLTVIPTVEQSYVSQNKYNLLMKELEQYQQMKAVSRTEAVPAGEMPDEDPDDAWVESRIVRVINESYTPQELDKIPRAEFQKMVDKATTIAEASMKDLVSQTETPKELSKALSKLVATSLKPEIRKLKTISSPEQLVQGNPELPILGRPGGKTMKFQDFLKPDSELLKDLKPEETVSVIRSNGLPENRITTLPSFKTTYDKYLMQADICRAIDALSRTSETPLLVQDIKITNQSNAANAVNEWKITFKDPTNKTRFTAQLLIPIPDSYGNIRLNGQRKIIHGQITGVVIKTGPDEVTVTTWANKAICIRSKNFNSTLYPWFQRMADTRTDAGFEIRYDDSGKSSPLLPINIRKLTENSIGGCRLNDGKIIFDFVTDKAIRSRLKLPGDGKYKSGEWFAFGFIEDGDETLGCFVRKGEPGIAYHNNAGKMTKLAITPEQLMMTVLETETRVGRPGRNKAPQRIYSLMQVLRKKLPIGLALAYLIGIPELVKRANIKSVFVPIRSPVGAELRNFDSIVFSDGTLYYEDSPEAMLLLSGFSTVNTTEFPYEDLREAQHRTYGLLYATSRWIKQTAPAMMLDSLRYMADTFVDHTSTKLLEEQNIPSDFVGLFIHVSDLLVLNEYQPPASMQNQRVRSNETIAHSVNRQLMMSYNTYRRNVRVYGNLRKVRFEIKPTCVVNDISNLGNVALLTGLAPTVQCSEMNKVGRTGYGGINMKRAITIAHRNFDESMNGVFSTATSFTGTAGSVRFMVSKSKLDPRGRIDKDHAATNHNDLAPLERLSPYVKGDDGPRTLMGYTQTEHFKAPVVNDLPLYSDGGEKLIPLMSPDFAFRANSAGVVKSVDLKKGLVLLEYDTGEIGYIDLRPTVVKNNYIRFSVAATLSPALAIKKGYKFSKDEILAYDASYFQEPQGYNEGVSMGVGMLNPIALYEDGGNYEDGTLISREVSDGLGMTVVDEVEAHVPANAVVEYIADIGKNTLTDMLLFRYVDSFDDSSLSSLSKKLLAENSELGEFLSKETMAHYSGELIDITMYWNVPREEMSESVGKMIDDYIKREDRGVEFAKTADFVKTKPLTALRGQKMGSSSYTGITIKFSIQHSRPLHAGNKANFFSPLKGIFSTVIENELRPEAEFTGRVNAMIGVESFKGRKTPSFILEGFVNKIIVNMKVKGKEFYDKKQYPALKSHILKMAKAFGPGNLGKYQRWLKSLTDEGFVKWADLFFNSPRMHFFLEIEQGKLMRLPEMEAIVKQFDLPPLEERIVFHHIVEGVPVACPTKVPVVWLHIRPHQQFLFKKAKITLNYRRSQVTGKLQNDSRIGRGASEMDINAYHTMGLPELAAEKVLLKGDNAPAKNLMLDQIANQGYYNFSDIPIKMKDTASVRYSMASVIGAHFGMSPYLDRKLPILPGLEDKLLKKPPVKS